MNHLYCYFFLNFGINKDHPRDNLKIHNLLQWRNMLRGKCNTQHKARPNLEETNRSNVERNWGPRACALQAHIPEWCAIKSSPNGSPLFSLRTFKIFCVMGSCSVVSYLGIFIMSIIILHAPHVTHILQWGIILLVGESTGLYPSFFSTSLLPHILLSIEIISLYPSISQS